MVQEIVPGACAAVRTWGFGVDGDGVLAVTCAFCPHELAAIKQSDDSMNWLRFTVVLLKMNRSWAEKVTAGFYQTESK
jgi:hypothetical protein